MDSARIRRELSGSIRLLWARERWLWSGLFAVLAGFAFWVGATGVAMNYGAEFAGQPLSVMAWSATTTAVFAVVTVLWVLVPAAVVTYLVTGYVTNVSGNVHTHYRVDHPFTFVAPFLGLFLAGAGGAVALGTVPAALAGALVAVGLLVLVRTLAYSYRVFSFSVPLVVQAALFASLAVTAVALLVSVATLAGRRAFVEAAATGIAGVVGSTTVADVLTGTTTAGPVTVPTLLGLAAVLPAVLALGYILVQNLVGFLNRSRKPDVPRSRLRTGQRYPDFARPVSQSPDGGAAPTPSSGTATANGGTPSRPDSSSASATAAPADSSETATADDTGSESAGKGSEAESDCEDPADDVSHTRVFTAPDDGGFDADVPNLDDGDDAGDDTAVVGGAGGTPIDSNGYRCPTCADTFGSGTNFAYCPTCGTELQPE
jgi:hypothetical protein